MRRNAGGFVLVATLWALAALAVLAAYIDGVVTSDLRLAIEAKRGLEAELARRSTEATLVYLLTTGRMNHRGLILEAEQRFSNSLSEDENLPDHGDGELRATGAVYAGPGGTASPSRTKRAWCRSTRPVSASSRSCSSTWGSPRPT